MNRSSSRKRSLDGGDASSEKRRRRHNKGGTESSRSCNRSSTPTRKALSFLQGKLFAVSTLAEASSEDCPEGYSQIVSLCRDLGAQTTGQVHRRVNAVIATRSAVEGNTQRVRKAWKKGIPVVSPNWIRECMKKGRSLDMGPYLQQEETRPEKEAKRREAQRLEKDNAEAHTKEQEITIDLGCCCVCHETASGRTECEWCIDCTVNLAHNKETEKQAEKEVTIDLGCCCVCHEEKTGPTECAWCTDCSVNKQYTK